MSSLAIKQRIDELVSRFGNNRVSSLDLRTILKELVDYVDENAVAADLPFWNSTTTYALNDLVVENDRIWKSKIANNLGNQPPQDTQVTSDVNWQEVSKGTNLSDWSPGLFGSGLIITFYNNKFYKLDNPNRPFESVNIETEIANGDWITILSGNNPVALISDPSYAIPGPGTYIYTGGTQANWSLPALADSIPGDIIRIKARSSQVLLNAAGSDKLYTTEERSSILMFAGDNLTTLIAESYWTL